MDRHCIGGNKETSTVGNESVTNCNQLKVVGQNEKMGRYEDEKRENLEEKKEKIVRIWKNEYICS